MIFKLFEFYRIFKLFYLTMFIVMRESNVKNLASFHVNGLKDAHEHEYHFFTNFTS
jgi:hypothetical protein